MRRKRTRRCAGAGQDGRPTRNGEGQSAWTRWRPRFDLEDDGVRRVSLFATLPGNSGPGVGDVVFDRASRQFFASDLDSGLVHRFSETGQVIDSFDHGVTGRPQKGLAGQ